MSKNEIFTIVKKALWGVFLTVFAFIAVIAVWLTVSKLILKSPVPSVLGYASLTVETGSMGGTIEIGDMIIIKEQKEYKVGDIVTYLHDGDTIPTTHRIIGYNDDGSFVTRGDSNNTKDPEPVSEDIIIGKVIKILPNAGIFVTWLQTDGWLYIVACLAILGLGFFVLSSDSEEDSSDKPEKPLSKNDEEKSDGAIESEASDGTSVSD